MRNPKKKKSPQADSPPSSFDEKLSALREEIQGLLRAALERAELSPLGPKDEELKRLNELQARFTSLLKEPSPSPPDEKLGELLAMRDELKGLVKLFNDGLPKYFEDVAGGIIQKRPEEKAAVDSYLEALRFFLSQQTPTIYMHQARCCAYSLLVWRWAEDGQEEAVLKFIPGLLRMDCRFFLEQPWLRRQLCAWYEQGDEKKIRRAFFGTRQRGKRSFKLTEENRDRDVRIVFAVEKLLAQRVGYNEAIRQVRDTVGELGIQDRLSFSGIRKIHRDAQPWLPHQRLLWRLSAGY